MEIATLISLGFNLLLTLLLLYWDWSRRSEAKNKDEIIKDLSLKLISRTTAEYIQAKGEAVKDTVDTIEPFVELEDVDTKTLLSAKDKI